MELYKEIISLGSDAPGPPETAFGTPGGPGTSCWEPLDRSNYGGAFENGPELHMSQLEDLNEDD